ncbi:MULTISPECIES: PAS domain-containing sensor histidine kinase [unclassified Idiomarina]|uniref:sensor histidine kinase n=1 Tax=unclassified Idiomarina TaxID=2614829 RepID=UPI000C96F8E3|nr:MULTISPECIES: PAS domain-containing sensor histidine kinase [unclassified Idiomarina]MAD53729.1 PAS domain-containing sensor histidine kinase [Idiomarinaceae bacterium]MEC7642529.1 PAS domain-containing sensor histidine kinase [Pseudomonadota bacterium]NQZ05482.1 PAS domain-containing sensor histidine kinase [Idiomarina sp.]|tara:strand:+ start:2560 stop:3558 length:999 start_codon:yes stop_codon:yes gene_type:complete
MQSNHALIDAMPNAVILVNGDGVVEYCNPNSVQLMGANLCGELWRDCVARTFTPRADDWHEVSLHNGRRVRVDISSLPNQPGQLVVLTDLTETRDLQAQLAHLQRLSSMGRMVASLAHQIRTPLSTALLYAEHLSTSHLDAAQRVNFSSKLKTRLHDLEHHVNDMLLFAKSGQKSTLADIDSNQLMTHIEQTVEAYAKQRGVVIQWQCEASPQTLKINKTAVAGAIQNLITNAIDASREGQPVTVETKTDAGLWCCCVRDSGEGIDDAMKARLFTPFATNKPHGTGLGLAVVDTVAKAHGGKIKWHSEKGQGSEFMIMFPTIQQSNLEVRYG